MTAAPRVVLLTAAGIGDHDRDLRPLAQALADLGAVPAVREWDDPALGDLPADLAVIRSTWDYSGRLDEYLAVLDALPFPVVNRLPVVRWNARKTYLAGLAAAGVPVVPTTVVPAGPDPVLPDVDADRVVVKPSVSAGGRGVGLFPAGSPAALEHLRTLAADRDVLVQPFLPDVALGERSLVFLDGRYSHAVRKVPADGGYLVQERHGGTTGPHRPTDDERAVADAALARVPGGADDLLYARVDLVGPGPAPLLMELELIEPGLFLGHAPGGAAALARAALDRITDGL
ncbi:ATP-grasp domain-containing protein [Nakamurella endophytica]|uniref:ATP-grasp domain-containing protein n=1 Tax=Nakamurella endophytica TaxID=1748367 RepID=A0A917T3Z4_9ACTN|nr:hypothetical protein [Nakamurella endophytica]GGM07503.1 ATP-grasp domain-containing protein [Nakamurella endophytica]